MTSKHGNPAETGNRPVAIAGFHSPSVGFEQPFEMLEACHERVERSLGLLERLLTHVEANGHDSASRSAATDVLRYFDIAAPHHHEDEERHIFPALAASGDEHLREAVARLKADHVHMGALWARLRILLMAWRDDESAPMPNEADRALVNAFTSCYEQHIPLEESLVYPAARQQFDAARLSEIGGEMAARRRQ